MTLDPGNRRCAATRTASADYLGTTRRSKIRWTYAGSDQVPRDVLLFEALTNRQLVEIARSREDGSAGGHAEFNKTTRRLSVSGSQRGKLRVLINNMEVARLGASGSHRARWRCWPARDRTGSIEIMGLPIGCCAAERDFLGLVDAYPEARSRHLEVAGTSPGSSRSQQEQKRINTLVGMVWGKDGPAEEPPPVPNQGARPSALSGANFPRTSLANSGTNFPRVPRDINRKPPRTTVIAGPRRPRPFGDGARTRRARRRSRDAACRGRWLRSHGGRRPVAPRSGSASTGTGPGTGPGTGLAPA